MATDIVPIDTTQLTTLEETVLAGTTGTPVLISAAAGESIEMIDLQLVVTFDAAPTANGNTVDLYGPSSPDGGTTVDQDAGDKAVGQNYEGTICDDLDASTNTYKKTIGVRIGKYSELLIANHTDADVTVSSAKYTGYKVVNS